GDVDSGEVQKWVRELFGSWKGGAGKTSATPPAASHPAGDPEAKGADATRPPSASGSSMETATPLSKNPANAGAAPGEFTRLLSLPQSSVLVGVPGPAIGDADFDDLRVLGAGLTILSFEELIFKRRAAFTATAVPEALREGGAFALVVVAQNARRDEAVFEVQRQMRHLALEGLEQKELDDFARVEAGREAAALQGVLPSASALAYGAAAGLPRDSHRSGGSPQRLKDLANRFLGPGSWIVITVGPPSP
ncbi:MAG TPA: insulinase family protein, partial [Candidatus Polarisedimenticolia bacterium]|nr:insulinase family protein [Candidatus Polarisedimenticolia bacterium]